MKITIYGAGYVGLVTGACFAELGNHVLCVDKDADRIVRLSRGECPIHEPELPEMLQRNQQAGRLSFTTDAAAGVAHGFYQFIAVGTPSDKNGLADVQYVMAVAEMLGKTMEAERLIITKSTVPVGTADKVRGMIQQGLKWRGKQIPFDVVSNPEFLREGAAVEDFMGSDRILIGVENETADAHMRALYAPFNRNQNRLISMDIRSAEFTKYVANGFLAMKISFMNEMSRIAELLGADIERVRQGIGSDHRIGFHFINPGCGYGGSCFPKDVLALQSMAKVCGYEAELIKAIHQVNVRQKQVLFNKIRAYFQQDLPGKTIALWGLSFKPHTDDMREASSRTLIELLCEAGAKVQAYDPVAMPEAKKIYGDRLEFKYCDSAEAALEGADALAIVTEWEMFLSPDFERIKQKLRFPAIFDGRNLYDPVYLSKMGFHYFGIGRGMNANQVRANKITAPVMHGILRGTTKRTTVDVSEVKE